MKILILSKEAWRSEENGGNVLSNIFSQIDAEYAQIYCMEAEPSNSLCKHYYQMTDRMMVNNIMHGKKVGKIVDYKDYPKTAPITESFSSAKRFNWIGVQIARELVWKFARWDKEAIKQFVQDFNPDVIFAPCYGTHYMIRLTNLVSGFCCAPIVSYISDDFYTNKQLRFSILYWLNHFLLRKHVRQVFKKYRLVYTMTDEQKEQCERDLHANMKILRKGGAFLKEKEKTTVNSPIRIVYAGSLYVNRWKTLTSLAQSIRELNKDSQRFKLDIYTNSILNSEQKAILDDKVSSEIHETVTMDELWAVYRNSDIALHAEGFDLVNRLKVRLSFSTKIVDCLDSGCAVMAICDSKQAGLAYLKRNDAAICVTDLSQLDKVLLNLSNNSDIIVDYQHKAFALGRKNHNAEAIAESIKADFNSLKK